MFHLLTCSISIEVATSGVFKNNFVLKVLMYNHVQTYSLQNDLHLLSFWILIITISSCGFSRVAAADTCLQVSAEPRASLRRGFPASSLADACHLHMKLTTIPPFFIFKNYFILLIDWLID